MATTENRLSKIVGDDGKSQVIVKLNISRSSRPCIKSGIYVKEKFFRPVKETKHGVSYGIVPPKKSKQNFLEVRDVTDAKNRLDGFINRLYKICQVAEAKNKDIVTKEWITAALNVTSDMNTEDITYQSIVDKITAKKDKETRVVDRTFFGLFSEYIEKQQHSYDEIKGHKVILRALQRYEYFVQHTDKERRDFALDIDSFGAETIEDFESFLRNEHALYTEYPKIFQGMPNVSVKRRSSEPRLRGSNTIIKFKKKLNTFFHWLNRMDITQNRPFEKVVIGAEKYGTPYYLTLEERNIIADHDFSYNKHLEAQRDIFVFQCCIGCRVGDLVRMTKNNVINDAIEYIPNKTRDGRPNLVRVPLNDRARNIINKYKGSDTPALLPFISVQKYNDSIKDILTICKIDRMVTILNPTTGKEEQERINRIASSHMARRTFIGNLYKQVKDPNLVGALSGHKEGSRAFVRYRDIDEDMKKDLVKLID